MLLSAVASWWVTVLVAIGRVVTQRVVFGVGREWQRAHCQRVPEHMIGWHKKM